MISLQNAVRIGLRQIKGLSRNAIDTFVERRGGGYDSVRDVWLRSGLDVDEIEKLAQADAFRSIGLGRREALWAVKALDRKSALSASTNPVVMTRLLGIAIVIAIQQKANVITGRSRRILSAITIDMITTRSPGIMSGEKEVARRVLGNE